MTRFHKIGIIGLGLMGGSIFKALQGKRDVLADEDLLERLDEIDLLILAVPISAILVLGEKIAQQKLRRPLVVCDIGSVKGEISERFEEWSQDLLEFIATHPMAGKVESGFEASDPELFQEATWVITPHAKNSETALQKIEELIALLGSQPLRMPAGVHDRRAAIVSHMPYLVSKALLRFASKEDSLSLEMAGPGFRSMTRLAKDNPELRAEIAKYNKTNIADTLKKFIEFLEQSE